jgi:3-hydroxyisobutyrate dehydrogenase-like beta-hydroxyacid dehydrogenase
MRAAFIGLGNMGLGMAHNLLKAGIATTVFDVRAEPVQSAV